MVFLLSQIFSSVEQNLKIRIFAKRVIELRKMNFQKVKWWTNACMLMGFTWFLAWESENDISFAIQSKELSIFDFSQFCDSVAPRAHFHETTIWGEDEDIIVNRTIILMKPVLWF